MAQIITEVLTDVESLTQRALTLVLETIQTQVAQRGQCTLVLAGGSTPRSLYGALAHTDLPWEQLQIFWGDERYVPADHPDSNQGMARQVWLDQVPIPPTHLHPMPTDSGDPQRDAQRYEAHLQTFFQLDPQTWPVFDLVLLGIGPDAHTASLFPHTPALQVGDRLVTVGTKDQEPRITLTVPVLNAARQIIFLVAGANKQAALGQIFAPQGDDLLYPARLIRPAGPVYWLLDAAAGEGL